MNASAAVSKITRDAGFFARARTHMVESQLRPNRIVDEKLLRAFSTLPREAFVAEEHKDFAYIDDAVAMGQGRKLLAPMTIARLIQEMELDASSARVLDIGAGTGYVAALLNDMAGEVIALESDPVLMRQLQKNKQHFLMDDVRPEQGALGDGYPPSGPYQGIFIEGAIQWLPEKIGLQLAEGGRLACIVYPEGDTFGRMGRAMIYERRHGVLSERHLFEVAAPVLPGFSSRPRFVF